MSRVEGEFLGRESMSNDERGKWLMQPVVGRGNGFMAWHLF